MKLFVAFLLTLEIGTFRVNSSSLLPSTMKFFKIVTAASFPAGNTVAVAAYEVPSDNLIKDLADEHDAETEIAAFLEDKDKMLIETPSSSSAYGLLRGRVSSFEEKKKKHEKDRKYWLKCEADGCEDCKYWKEKMKELTSGPQKENAKKHLHEATAATLRAEAELSSESKSAWEAFKEKYGADLAEGWADVWETRHESSSSYDGGDGDTFEFSVLDGGDSGAPCSCARTKP